MDGRVMRRLVSREGYAFLDDDLLENEADAKQHFQSVRESRFESGDGGYMHFGAERTVHAGFEEMGANRVSILGQP